MPRKGPVAKREVLPDPIFHSKDVTRLINRVMVDGKRGTASNIVYSAFDIIKESTGNDPLEVYIQALDNVKPDLEVKARRVGGSNYQVPVEVRPERQITLALRWIVNFSRNRGEHTMEQRLAKELMDAANNTGASVKKREETHKMAEANRAFAHYRW
ncbi:30S ribosomal protein S7 [Vagococcus sp.]|uniref:30S ribosomal protein S7 n=1 Tax=Vagococcus sp. TaxID=1933889 RepID=UPI000EC8C3DE|nr:30S ribosomal protein S7 [Vagococcus sp.]HCT96415.1 30S ribosomal protein S7 [Vagococcus sp.]